MSKVFSIGIRIASVAAAVSASLSSQAALITSSWVDRTDTWTCINCVTQWKNSDGSNRFPNNGADTFSVNLGPGSGAQPQSVIQLDQNITIDNFSQTGHTLTPLAGVKRPTLTINNLFSWTAGTISGNLQVISNGPPLGKSLSINGTPLLNGATLINRGDATMSGGGLIGNTRAVGNSRTQVFNTGTFSITDNSILDVLGKATNVEPLFENRGIFRKTGGAAAGQSSIGWDFINNGAVQVQTGTLTIGATGKYSQPMGSLTVDKGAIFRSTKDLTIGGSIGGEGTIQAPNVKNNAIIDPNQKGAAGELNINGNLALSGRSDLQIALGGKAQGSQYDVLDVTDGTTGTVTLGGLLEVYFIDDFQDEITSSDTFTILTADTPLGGSFSDVASGERLSTADGFGSFIVTYNGDNVVLSDFARVSEPSTMALFGSGLIVLGWRLRQKKHKSLNNVHINQYGILVTTAAELLVCCVDRIIIRGWSPTRGATARVLGSLRLIGWALLPILCQAAQAAFIVDPAATDVLPKPLVANPPMLVVGNTAAGKLMINGGSMMNVTISDAILGQQATGNGTLTITNAKSLLNVVHGTLQVGGKGTGTLVVSDKGTVTAANSVNIGADGGTGTATVTGAGSSLTTTSPNTAGLTVGLKSNGSLKVAKGASVSADVGVLGSVAKILGMVDVVDAGSTLNIKGQLTVGQAQGGFGILNIGAGGKASAGRVDIGFQDGSNGRVTVSGPNSLLDSSNVIVGVPSGKADSVLTINGGGKAGAKNGLLTVEKGGVLEGMIDVLSNINNKPGGKVALGPPGQTDIAEGSYTQAGLGELDVGIANPKQVSLLDVATSATLDPSSIFDFTLDNYLPKMNDQFEFLEADSISLGSNPTIDVQGVTSDSMFVLQIEDISGGREGLFLVALNNATLVPEPSTILMLTSDLLLIAGFFSRRRAVTFTPSQKSVLSAICLPFRRFSGAD